MKAALHQHDKVLDDKIEEFKIRIGNLDSNADALKQENKQMQQVLNSSSGSTEITSDNVN